MVHQLQISLNETNPQVWRNFKINSHVTFHQLHIAIQIVMGWRNCHPYEFETLMVPYNMSENERLLLIQSESRKVYKIVPEIEDNYFDNNNLTPSNSIEIIDVLTEINSEIAYNYDFGDAWEHVIKVENIIENEILLSPQCINGAMCCPPENCGGIYGFNNLLTIITNRKNPKFNETIKWLGNKFNPNAFNLLKVNKLLSLI